MTSFYADVEVADKIPEYLKCAHILASVHGCASRDTLAIRKLAWTTNDKNWYVEIIIHTEDQVWSFTLNYITSLDETRVVLARRSLKYNYEITESGNGLFSVLITTFDGARVLKYTAGYKLNISSIKFTNIAVVLYEGMGAKL